MQPTRQRLLELLADGEFHSGERLGAALGISRAAVWKQVAALGELGLRIERQAGRGYGLAQPLELLNANRIAAGLNADVRARLRELRVLDDIDSTNAELMRESELPADHVVACLAERQTAGRGRRGRPWLSPFGRNLYLSLSWPFDSLPPDFPALSLAMGVATRRALGDVGIGNVALKWPNDLYVADAKLGGILLEMRGEPPGPCRIVAGVGINVNMPADAAVGIEQAWTDLASVSEEVPSRNWLAAAVLNRWLPALTAFARDGFGSFIAEWRAADLLAGREVFVAEGAQRWQGTARGVGADGALEVILESGLKRFVAGDASLREVP